MGGSPYLGKLSKEDKEFFGNLKGSKAIQSKDRIKPEKKDKPDPLTLRGDLK